MSLSPSDEWKDAIQRADPETRFLLELTDGTTSWKAVSGSTDLISEPEAVLAVDSVEAQLDPLTRKAQAGAIEVEVSDDWLRPILVNNRLRHQKAIVTHGAKGVSESNLLAYFAGPIEEINPEGGEKVVLKIEDIFSLLEKTEVVGFWIGQHPLQIMEDIFSKAKIPAAFIDSTAFDPSQAVYESIRHYVVSRGGITRYFTEASTFVDTPISAFKLISELSELLHGNLAINESGQITFLLFDASAASVDSWGPDQIRPDTFEQVGSEGIIINQFNGHFNRGSGAEPVGSFTLNETVSQSDNAFPGSTERILSYDIETNWLDHRGALLDAPLSDVATSFAIRATHFLTGSRGAPSVPSGATISGGRPAYLLFYDQENGHEIVKAVTLSFGSVTEFIEIENPETDAITFAGPFVYNATFSGVERGALETTARAHGFGAAIFDITLLVDLALKLFRRWKDECAIIKLRTGPDQGDKQLGDFIDLTWPEFLAFGQDGLSDDTFEIIAKLYDPDADEYEWRLAEAKDDNPTTSGVANAKKSRLPLGANIGQSLLDETLLTPHVVSGLVGTLVSGFDVKITLGSASAYPNVVILPEDFALTLEASKDTWVTFDTATESLVLYPETLSDPQPTKTPTEVFLCKFVTDGSGATSVDNSIKPSDRLVDDIVTSPAILDLAITTAKLAALAVTEAKIDALAVTVGKIGALAVTSAKLAAAAVTAGKIAVGGISNANQFAANVVDNAAIGPSAVDTAELAVEAVTNEEVADDTLGISNFNTEYEQGGSIMPDPSISLYTRG